MAKKEEKSFEENLTELESIVKSLESGNVPLDDAINKFNEAMLLSKECNDKLKSAEENVNKILKENGNLEDFKLEEDDE
jgi:exodeoxyribonuclease VII small subunit